MQKVFLLLCYCQLLSSCLPDNQNINIRIRGKVIDEITEKPVPDLPVVLIGRNLWTLEKRLLQTVTNNNGEFTFVYERNAENYDDFKDVYLVCDRKDSVDTNAVAWKYHFSSWLNSEQNIVMARNTGELRIGIMGGAEAWDSLNLEWIVVKSTNFQDSITSKYDAIYFYEVPSQTHTIKWYFKRNGKVSKVFTDNVYVSNRYSIYGGHTSYGVQID